jgi:hypothetical protein
MRTFIALIIFTFVLMGMALITEAATITLAWDAPTTNEDGTPLTDLAGYKLYWGLAPGNYTNTQDVGNVTQYTLDIGPVEDARVYFNVTAYDDKGNESDYDGEINAPFGPIRPAPPQNLRQVRP